MSSGIIENAEELKNLYLQTDISDVSSVQSSIKGISENVYVAGKDKYLDALNAATPANLSKARRYNNMSSLMKKLGWIIMAVFVVLMVVIDSDYEDSITTWLSLGFWVGVGIQIYIAVLKSAWNKLTLSGSVIHSALGQASSPMQATNTTTNVPMHTAQSSAPTKHIFCSECGRQNKEDAQFCENCGAKL